MHRTRRSPTTQLLRNLSASGLATVLLAGTARASLIDVQFVSVGGNGTVGTAGTPFSGAALTGGAGDQWNTFQSASASGALLTSSGASSGVSLSYSGNVVYGLTPSQQQFLNTPYAALMQSFLVSHASDPAMTLTFTGLAPGHAFSMYLYGQSASNSYGETVTVNGTTQTSLQTNAAAFIDNNNYLLFQGVASAAGTIAITDATAPGRGEADLNGIQLVTVDVPEPPSIAIVGCALAGLTAVWRRRG